MEEIPSPFFNKDQNEGFIDLLDYIFKSHGYDQWAFVVAKDNKDDTEDWTGNSNVISTGMVETLKEVIKYMESVIDEEE